MRVRDWQLKALYAGFPMNRKIRRAAERQQILFLRKMEKLAKKGSKYAKSVVEAWNKEPE